MIPIDITFKGLGIISTLYLAPTISPQGWITGWKGKHSRWKHGFVVRFLWAGFLLRWGKIPYHETPRGKFERQFNNMIEQANDGDYLLDLALAEEPH